MKNELLKKGAAELFGTFVLVFFAVGTAVGTAWFSQEIIGWGLGVGIVDLVATALAFGFVIIAMAYTIGRVSGCHINPAVSLGAFMSKRITGKELLVYIAAQIVGAILGAVALYGIMAMALGGIEWLDVWGTNGMIDSSAGWTAGNIIGSLLLEIIMTAVFVYVILAVTSKKGSPKKAGFIIGLTLTLIHLLGISFTGTSVNPARSLGPAIMQAAFGGGTAALEQVWIFIIAPLIGGILAALLFKAFHGKEEKEMVKIEENASAENVVEE